MTETLHRELERRADQNPDAPALVFGAESWTYGELAGSSAALAENLRERGVGPDVRVGVWMDRRPEVLITLLAVLRAGGAYLPLDPSFPEARLRFMIEDGLDGGRGLIVTRAERSHEVAPLAPEAEIFTVPTDLRSSPVSRRTTPTPELPSDRLAYLLYTSGSTGRPKGVQISHTAAGSFLRAIQARIRLGPEDVLVAVTTLSFDISVLELFLPLSVGGRVALADRETAWDGHRLRDLLETSGATALQATPATWRLLWEAGWRGSSKLEKVLCGGEAMPEDLARKLVTTGAEVWNLYGPTEATVWTTAHRLSSEAEPGSPPIGRPLDNSLVHLLDENLTPVPDGEAAEVYVAGPGLSRGYLHLPGRTAESFLPNPHGEIPGDRLYRVGDLARLRPDGNLEFLGRVDHQVKIRGFRIELGEIESVLSRHSEVRECAVVARDDGADTQRLVGYVVWTETAEATVSDLRAFLGDSLPDYMVPSRFVPLERLPRHPNGKIARRDLPDPPSDRPDLGAAPEPPRNAAEETLVEIWESTLGVEGIGIHDNFFELGGHSLAALHVVTRVRNHFGLDLHLGVLVRTPTIAGLATFLGSDSARDAVPLVRMGHGDVEGTPFFCVHGAGGFVFRLVDLARAIAPDRPFYGIQGWTDLKDDEFTRSIEELAKSYLVEVRGVQPEGPYLLGGYSMGALIAFEMTRQLEAVGETVALLGILDTPALEFGLDLDLDALLYEAALAQELRIPVTDEEIRSLPPDRRLPLVIERGLKLGVLPQGFRVADAAHYLRRFQATFQAYGTYELADCEARITFFPSEVLTSHEAYGQDSTLGWGRLSRSGVDVHPMTGNHVTMLRPPHVEPLARQLLKSIERSATGVAERVEA